MRERDEGEMKGWKERVRERGRRDDGVETKGERDTEDNVERRLLPISAVSSAKHNSGRAITSLWRKFLLRVLFCFF